ncbi:MAG TPA: hypothetical protein VHC69_30640 [Polyangiaceae bacterium]|nr:hypothetical protein [Polyangiaceae bacterium]
MAETYPTSVGRERNKLGAVVGGGASVEAIAGLAAVTLAVLALAGVLSFYMLTIAMIVAGAALLVDGISVGAAYRELRRAHAVQEGKRDLVPVSTGLSAQVLGGAIAVIVGILGLLGSFSATMTAIAVIVLGTALLVGAMTHDELDWSALALHDPSASARPAIRRTLRIAEFSAAIVVFLGVLSLVAIAGPTGGAPFTLILIALLGIGIAEFLDGSAVLGRIAAKPPRPRDIRDHQVRGLP